MSNKLHNELKKEFQLERLILFSDAVFAIAITLLVIEIKIPEIHEKPVTDNAVLHKLAELIPKFVGFLVSFLLIGQYWIVHHRMFSFVINFTDRLIWLNILFLFAIALMPFSTGFYSEYVLRGVVTPVIFYTGNIALLGLANFLMWRYLSNQKNNLTENLTPALAKYFSLRALTVPVIFVIFSFVYLYNPTIAFFIPILIPFILRLIFNPMKKKITNPGN
ncbi:MAG TPA: TMEM175 family protein [Chitinophagaceae bacterium]|nr:TMEM175 family protein [Chitinophagaceae bacterium]